MKHEHSPSHIQIEENNQWYMWACECGDAVGRDEVTDENRDYLYQLLSDRW